MTAGYSGTPLARKLGIAEGGVVVAHGAPEHLPALLDGVVLRRRGTADVVLQFVTRRRLLESRLPVLAERIFPDRTLWVCWPKRASGVKTDVTENVVREVALPLGLVDVKVCAVDETWSGLKLVHRVATRSRPPRGSRR